MLETQGEIPNAAELTDIGELVTFSNSVSISATLYILTLVSLSYSVNELR